MKKNNLKKLSLKKSAVSNLDEVSGGIAKPQNPIDITVASVCGTCSRVITNCITGLCSIKPMCNDVSYFIC